MKTFFILMVSCGLCFGQQYLPFYIPSQTTIATSSNNWATAFNTGTSSGLRTDGPNVVGCQFVIGATNITVFTLGRTNAATSSLTHPIAIFNSSGVIVVSNTIPPSPSIGWQWVTVTDTVLTAGATYYLGSLESSDPWFDHMAAIVSPAASLANASFSTYPPFVANTTTVTANTIYVGLSFGYR